MRITFAYIRSFNGYRFRFRTKSGSLKVRLAVGTRSRGRAATRTATLMNGIRPDAAACDIRAIVAACAKFYAHPIAGWRVVWRFEAVRGEAWDEPAIAETKAASCCPIADHRDTSALRAAAIAAIAAAVPAKFGHRIVMRR